VAPIRSLSAALALSAGLVAGGGWLASELAPTASSAPSTARAALGETEAASAARPLSHDGLRVEARGVRSNRGSIVVTLYDDADALARYDDERAVGFAEVPASVGAVSVDFPDLTGGPYAITVFHDENGDRDFNMDGEWPLEGYGTSGAKGAYDEPSFERASTTPGRTSVDIYYLQ